MQASPKRVWPEFSIMRFGARRDTPGAAKIGGFPVIAWIKRRLLRPFRELSAQISSLEERLDRVSSRVDSQLDEVSARLGSRLDGVSSSLSGQIDKASSAALAGIERATSRVDLRIEQSSAQLDGCVAQVLLRVEEMRESAADEAAKRGLVEDERSNFLRDLKGQIDALAGELHAVRSEVAEEARRAAHAHTLDVDERHNTQRQIGDVLARVQSIAGETPERGQAYRRGLNAVGVLNYENDVVSGERRFLTLFARHHPKPVIFDVGANEGQYAKLAREIVPGAIIHSFEPSPVSFARLSKAAKQIGVLAHPLALGDARAEVDFFDYADEAGSQHASLYREVIEDIHKRPAISVKVRCETLDAISRKLCIDRIDLLKIDTEGHEMAVLVGARNLLESGAIDVIQFEFNEMNVIARVFMKDFMALLANYRFYRLLQDDVIEFGSYDPTFMEVFAYQNIACVRRDIDAGWIRGA